MPDPLTRWNNKAEPRLPKSNDLVRLKPARNGGEEERWMGSGTREPGETITISIKADSCPTPPLTLPAEEDCARLSPKRQVREGKERRGAEAFIGGEVLCTVR